MGAAARTRLLGGKCKRTIRDREKSIPSSHAAGALPSIVLAAVRTANAVRSAAAKSDRLGPVLSRLPWRAGLRRSEADGDH